MRHLSTLPPIRWVRRVLSGGVEPPTLTDTNGVFGCEFQPTISRRSRGIKFACDNTARVGTCGQDGEAAGLVPAVLHLFHRDKYTIEQMAADLETVLADADVDRAHVVGASMGGMIALQHALEYDRTASLSLLCTTAGGDMETLVPEKTRTHLDEVPSGLTERERIKYLMEPATTEEWRETNTALLDDIVDWRLEQDASIPAREAQAMGQLGWDVRDRLTEIDVPTLVMHGTGDEVVPFQRGEVLRDGLDCEFEAFVDAPHLFFIERAGEVNDRLRTFIEDVDG